MDVILVPMYVKDALSYLHMLEDPGTFDFAFDQYKEVLETLRKSIRTAVHGNKSSCDCQSIRRSDYSFATPEDIEVNQLEVMYCMQDSCGRELGNSL